MKLATELDTEELEGYLEKFEGGSSVHIELSLRCPEIQRQPDNLGGLCYRFRNT